MEATEHQLAALAALRDLESDGNRPSLEEWAQRMGLSYGTMIHYRRHLLAQGLIEMTAGQARSTRTTEKGRRALRRAS